MEQPGIAAAREAPRPLPDFSQVVSLVLFFDLFVCSCCIGTLLSLH